MSTIQYLKGDATAPVGQGPRIICHVCNDVGGWGAGFVLAISKRWSAPEQQFRAWYEEGSGFELGEARLVEVEAGLWVANMIGQQGLRVVDGVPPIRYEAVRRCLEQVTEQALALGASLHMPRIGCGLAGGKWPEVEAILLEVVCERGVAVHVYDFG